VGRGLARNDNVGNALKVWSLRRGLDAPIDSIVLPDIGNVSDVEVSADGKLLLLTTEGGSHGLYLYSLANPARPTAVGSYRSRPDCTPARSPTSAGGGTYSQRRTRQARP